MRQPAFYVEVGHGGMNGGIEFCGVPEGAMRQVVAFEVTPGPLDVVQLDGDPRACGQGGGGGFAGVDRPIVEHENNWLSLAS